MTHNHAPTTDWTNPQSIDKILLDPGIADFIKELHTFPGVGTFASCSGLTSDHNGTKDEYPYLVVAIDDQFPIGILVELMEKCHTNDWELSAKVNSRGIYELGFHYKPFDAYKISDLAVRRHDCDNLDWDIFDRMTDKDVKASWAKLRRLLRKTLGNQ